MTASRIKQIADFLYSSDKANVVPFRVSIGTGMYGYDLNYKQFIKLMTIFSRSINLKDDLLSFRNEVDRDE